jgi:hypothetical protein
MRPIGWQNASISLQSWRRAAAYYGQCKREHPTALGEAETFGNAVSVSSARIHSPRGAIEPHRTIVLIERVIQ